MPITDQDISKLDATTLKHAKASAIINKLIEGRKINELINILDLAAQQQSDYSQVKQKIAEKEKSMEFRSPYYPPYTNEVEEPETTRLYKQYLVKQVIKALDDKKIEAFLGRFVGLAIDIIPFGKITKILASVTKFTLDEYEKIPKDEFLARLYTDCIKALEAIIDSDQEQKLDAESKSLVKESNPTKLAEFFNVNLDETRLGGIRDNTNFALLNDLIKLQTDTIDQQNQEFQQIKTKLDSLNKANSVTIWAQQIIYRLEKAEKANRETEERDRFYYKLLHKLFNDNLSSQERTDLEKKRQDTIAKINERCDLIALGIALSTKIISSQGTDKAHKFSVLSTAALAVGKCCYLLASRSVDPIMGGIDLLNTILNCYSEIKGANFNAAEFTGQYKPVFETFEQSVLSKLNNLDSKLSEVKDRVCEILPKLKQLSQDFEDAVSNIKKEIHSILDTIIDGKRKTLEDKLQLAISEQQQQPLGIEPEKYLDIFYDYGFKDAARSCFTGGFSKNSIFIKLDVYNRVSQRKRLNYLFGLLPEIAKYAVPLNPPQIDRTSPLHDPIEWQSGTRLFAELLLKCSFPDSSKLQNYQNKLAVLEKCGKRLGELAEIYTSPDFFNAINTTHNELTQQLLTELSPFMMRLYFQYLDSISRQNCPFSNRRNEEGHQENKNILKFGYLPPQFTIKTLSKNTLMPALLNEIYQQGKNNYYLEEDVQQTVNPPNYLFHTKNPKNDPITMAKQIGLIKEKVNSKCPYSAGEFYSFYNVTVRLTFEVGDLKGFSLKVEKYWWRGLWSGWDAYSLYNFAKSEYNHSYSDWRKDIKNTFKDNPQQLKYLIHSDDINDLNKLTFAEFIYLQIINYVNFYKKEKTREARPIRDFIRELDENPKNKIESLIKELAISETFFNVFKQLAIWRTQPVDEHLTVDIVDENQMYSRLQQCFFNSGLFYTFPTLRRTDSFSLLTPNKYTLTVAYPDSNASDQTSIDALKSHFADIIKSAFNTEFNVTSQIIALNEQGLTKNLIKGLAAINNTLAEVNRLLTGFVSFQDMQLFGHSKGISCLTLVVNDSNPEDQILVSGSYDMKLMMWDMTMGAYKTLDGEQHNGWVLCVTDIGKQKVASGAYNDTYVRFWDTKKGIFINKQEHGAFIWALAASPSKKLLASGGGGNGKHHNRILIWDVDNFQKLVELNGHTTDIYSLQFIADDKLASSSADGKVYIWKIDQNNWIRDTKTLAPCHSLPVNSIAHIDHFLVSGSNDKTIGIWDLDTIENQIVAKKISTHTDSVFPIVKLSNRFFASASFDKTVKIWDIETLKCVHTFQVGKVVRAMQPLSNGCLVIGCWSGEQTEDVSQSFIYITNKTIFYANSDQKQLPASLPELTTSLIQFGIFQKVAKPASVVGVNNAPAFSL